MLESVKIAITSLDPIQRPPVAIKTEQNRDGSWEIDLELDEMGLMLKSIEYSLNGSPYKSTGREIIEPKMYIEDVELSPTNLLRIRYTTKKGKTYGPYEFPIVLSSLLEQEHLKDFKKAKRWFAKTGSTQDPLGAFRFVTEDIAYHTRDKETQRVLLNLPDRYKRFVSSVAMRVGDSPDQTVFHVGADDEDPIILLTVDEAFLAAPPDIRLRAKFTDGTLSSWRLVRRVDRDEYRIGNDDGSGMEDKDADALFDFEIPAP